MKFLVLMSVVLAVAYGKPMDIGSGGVYDSPLANDIYVRQFGWLFGGGRSGIYGLKAMQESVATYDNYQQPAVQSHTTLQDTMVKEKSMVELSPIKMQGEDSQPKLFHRFMAVP